MNVGTLLINLNEMIIYSRSASSSKSLMNFYSQLERNLINKMTQTNAPIQAVNATLGSFCVDRIPKLKVPNMTLKFKAMGISADPT